MYVVEIGSCRDAIRLSTLYVQHNHTVVRCRSFDACANEIAL